MSIKQKVCMQLLFGKKSSVLKVDACGLCGERVGFNSIQCTKCQMSDVKCQGGFIIVVLMCLGR